MLLLLNRLLQVSDLFIQELTSLCDLVILVLVLIILVFVFTLLIFFVLFFIPLLVIEREIKFGCELLIDVTVSFVILV